VTEAPEGTEAAEVPEPSVEDEVRELLGEDDAEDDSEQRSSDDDATTDEKPEA
jgi:hypothetical protein